MPDIRHAILDDAAAWARIVEESSPYLVQDARSTHHEMRTDAPDAVRLVAEVEGQVVALARLRAYEDEEHTSLQLMVLPSARRRGVGRALLDRMLRWAEATHRDTLHAIVEDGEDSRRAAAAWGFELTRTFRMSAVDPRLIPQAATDARVVDLTRIDPREIHALFNAVVSDDPSGLSLQTSYDEWLADWEDPRNRAELSRGVLVDGALVAFTQVGSAGVRAWSNMTGTRPDHRGLGLALLRKQHALNAAANAGIKRCFAGNDGDNAPMVAVNDRLGYRPFATPRLGVRPL